MISPPLQFGLQYRILAVIFFAILLFDVILNANAGTITLTKYGLAILLYFTLVSIIIEFLSPDRTPFIWWIQNYIFFAFYFIMVKMKKSNSLMPRFIILKTILIAQLIWIFRSIQGLTTDTTIARVLTRSNEQAEELSQLGYGGYGLVYSSLLTLPLFVGYVKKNKRRILNAIVQYRFLSVDLLIAINLLLTIVLVFKAGYMLAVVALLLFFILNFVFRGSIITRIVKASLFIGMILLINSRNILNSLGSIVTELNPNYGRKLNDILAYSKEGYLENNTLFHRVERYSRSINVFIENPFLGALSRDDLGKHSAILDAFAHYGLPLGLVYFFCVSFFLVREILPSKIFLNKWVFLLFLLFIFTTNNIVGTQGVVLFIIYPLLINYDSYAET